MMMPKCASHTYNQQCFDERFPLHMTLNQSQCGIIKSDIVKRNNKSVKLSLLQNVIHTLKQLIKSQIQKNQSINDK